MEMLRTVDNDQQISDLRQVCKRSDLVVPANDNSAFAETSKASSACDDNVETLQIETKREYATIAGAAAVSDRYSEEKVSVDLKEDNNVDECSAIEETEKEGPLRKRSRLADEVCKKPAVVPSNQVLVNAFLDFGEQESRRGCTGQCVTHLRAAHSIRDYRCAIISGNEARDVPLVGAKMAAQIEQILDSNSTARCSEASNQQMEKHAASKLDSEMGTTRAIRPENQPLVNELVKLGEHDQATREAQIADQVITPGDDACQDEAHIRPVTADMSDQACDYCHIDQEAPSGDGIQKVKDGNNAAQGPGLQHAVGIMIDDSDQHSGYCVRRAAFLRAAKAVRDTEVIVTSGKQATEAIKGVDDYVVAMIDQILKHEHFNTAEDDDNNSKCEQGGDEHNHGRPEILQVQETGGRPAQTDDNQTHNDAVLDQQEAMSDSTGLGTAMDCAVHQLHDAAELVTNSSVAKALGSIATFVNHKVGLTADSNSRDDEEE